MSYGFIQGCSAIRRVFMLPVTPPTSSNNTPFGGSSGFVNANTSIYVPDNSVDAYKANSYFSSVVSRIKPISEYDGQPPT